MNGTEKIPRPTSDDPQLERLWAEIRLLRQENTNQRREIESLSGKLHRVKTTVYEHRKSEQTRDQHLENEINRARWWIRGGLWVIGPVGTLAFGVLSYFVMEAAKALIAK